MCACVCVYTVNIMVSWFLLFPPFQFCCRRVWGLCLEYTLVCVYTYTRVRVYTHTHVHTVCACGGMCACKCMYWFTHTHPGTHPCACMYACAPCPPRHDSPLTPPVRQDGATPLFISAQTGHKDTVLALLQAGAAVDAKEEVRGALLSECMCVCLRIRV